MQTKFSQTEAKSDLNRKYKKSLKLSDEFAPVDDSLTQARFCIMTKN